MKKLAIIGAGYLQLPLVLKARECGVETHCFAWHEGAVCKDYADFFYPVSVVEMDTILKKCTEIGIDGITTIASDVAVRTVCYVAQHSGLISNTIESSLITTDKYLMREHFMKNGVNCPGYVIASENAGYNHLRYPLIVKPVDRSGSLGVQKVYFPDELPDAIARAQHESFNKSAIVEEFISGNEVSVETISWNGKHYILTITDKVTTSEPYFVELEHHQPSMLSDDIQKKIKTETIKALDSLDIKYGASHAEFKIDDTGEVYAIETGARMGGDFIGSDLVRLSTGYDFLKGILNIALGHFEEPVLTESNFSGVYFLAEETKRLLDIFKQNGHSDFVYQYEIQSEKLKKVECSADRSGYLIYKSDHKIIL